MASMVDKDKGQNNYNIIEIPKVVKDSLEAMILSSETIKSLAEQSIGMLLQSEKLTKQAESKCIIIKIKFKNVLYLVYQSYYFFQQKITKIKLIKLKVMVS